MSADIGMLSLIAQKNGKVDEQYLSNAYARNTSKTKAETLLKADAFLAGRTEKSDYMIYSGYPRVFKSRTGKNASNGNREVFRRKILKETPTWQSIRRSRIEKY